VSDGVSHVQERQHGRASVAPDLMSKREVGNRIDAMSRNDRLQPPYEGDHPAVQHRYFGDGVTVSGSGVVLERMQNPVAFLNGLRKANSGGLIVEVPCFDSTLRARAWFDIFYEHVDYFRIFADFRPGGGERALVRWSVPPMSSLTSPP
jgi:hypothetical protein